MTHYRAKLVLEQVEPYTDTNGYPREHTMPAIATVEVTADTPGAVMAQITEHVTALTGWHAP